MAEILGTPGDDVLIGGNDNDVLDGGAGNGVLTGGGGADQFHFAGAFSRRDIYGSGGDLVADFNAGEGDRLMFHGYTAGDLAFAPAPIGAGTAVAGLQPQW